MNANVVKQYGFSYNPSMAKTFLKESGYKGQKLTLEVPDGWTDWMAAIQIISQQLNTVGINVSPIYPQSNDRTADEASGNLRHDDRQQRRPRRHALELLRPGVPAPDR